MQPNSTVTKTAVILFAHGSSDPHWLAPFTQLLEQIQQQSKSNRVELAYLELAEPSLEQKIQQLVEEGFLQFEIIPLFFAAGRHLRKDVPQQLEQIEQLLQQQGVSVNIELHGPIGLEPEVATAISQTIQRKIT